MMAKPVLTKKTVVRPAKTRDGDKSLTQLLAETRKTLDGAPVHVVALPWELRSLGTQMGVTWHKALRVHLYEGATLPPVLQPYKTEPFSLERYIEDELNGKRRIPRPPTAPMSPRPHQEVAAAKIAADARKGWRGFVLADQVGVGKTISALEGIHRDAQMKGFSVKKPALLLILCPKAAIPHWRNTLAALPVPALRPVVINYDQVKKLLTVPAEAENAVRTRTKNKNTALHGKPNISWDYIIADEAHKLKNPDAQRSSAFNRVARYAATAQQSPFVVWASATIGQNPMELSYLAPLVGQMLKEPKPVTVKDWGSWLNKHNFHVEPGTGGSWSWVNVRKDMTPERVAEIRAQQQKDVERLGKLLFQPGAPSIRRNPEDIAGWPKQLQVPTPIVFDSAEQVAYQQAWEEFRHSIGMNPRGKNPAGALAATLRFRQKASLLMAPYTVDAVVDLLENNLQVVVSVEFIETLDVLRNGLEKAGYTVAELSGARASEREAERLRFQRGEAQVALFTVEEAISLHAGEQLHDGSKATSTPRALVVHDMRYSALSMSQILGRATRDGQLAIAYHLYAEGTVQAKILEVMLQKMKNLRVLSGDAQDNVDEILDLLDKLAS